MAASLIFVVLTVVMPNWASGTDEITLLQKQEQKTSRHYAPPIDVFIAYILCPNDDE